METMYIALLVVIGLGLASFGFFIMKKFYNKL